jgi:glycerol-3-phosphate dehydrogenase (NAD(P)+)
MLENIKVGVIGAGSWATALALLLAHKGCSIKMWTRSPELADEINHLRENKRYLPGVRIDGKIEVSTVLAYLFRESKIILFSVPSRAFEEVLRQCRGYFNDEMVFINTAKGITEKELYRMSEVFTRAVGNDLLERYVYLSGPSHAEEVSRDLPTAVVVSSTNLHTAEYVQELCMGKNFRVYTHQDLIGVELGGALKNIIALGTGIAEGLGFGDNTKAALMTRGMAEISRLGLSMGAKPLTFAGLAGIGDLIVTCTSMHSRNRRAGIALGRGKTLREAQDEVDMVVEGVTTTRAAYRLATRYQVEMPITVQVYKMLFEGLDPMVAVNNLMSRGRTNEMEEVL